MGRFVLDTSVVIAWLFDDETDEFADAVMALFDSDEALVPTIWPLEIANVLAVGERRGRITKADSARFVALLYELPISFDGPVAESALSDTLSLARSSALSAYDASYLELALRSGFPLATLDSRLRSAAVAVGVPLLAASVEGRA